MEGCSSSICTLQRTHIPALPDTTPIAPSKFASVPAQLQRLAGSQRPQKGSLTADLHGEGDVENWGG